MNRSNCHIQRRRDSGSCAAGNSALFHISPNSGNAQFQNAFTLMELLVVIAVIAVLAALLLPTLSKGKEEAQQTACLSNLRQIGIGMNLFANDNNECYPESGGLIPWDSIDLQIQKEGWMQQIFPNIGNKEVYRCPTDHASPFSYVNSARAAFVVETNFATVVLTKVQFPTAQVLSADTIWTGSFTNDADKDDYVQNCVGGETNGTPSMEWQRHRKGQNVLFTDAHARWYKGYSSTEMTFRYDSMHGWQ